MQRTHKDALWIKTLPRSRMIRPKKYMHWLKYALWRLYAPVHPNLRDAAVKTGLIWHEGRQDYLLGTIDPRYSLRDVAGHLAKHGFANHFVAWRDEGEVVSLRYVENFECQYHIRLYEDGEVRGHFEYTPECYPLRHMKEEGLEDRREFFFGILQDKIVPHPNTGTE